MNGGAIESAICRQAGIYADAFNGIFPFAKNRIQIFYCLDVGQCFSAGIAQGNDIDNRPGGRNCRGGGILINSHRPGIFVIFHFAAAEKAAISNARDKRGTGKEPEAAVEVGIAVVAKGGAWNGYIEVVSAARCNGSAGNKFILVIKNAILVEIDPASQPA